MSLADELADLTYQQLCQDPAGRAFLDGGEDALAAGGFGMADTLRILNIVLRAHTTHIYRLADEIDALKQASS